jgi:hypothetical protein
MAEQGLGLQQVPESDRKRSSSSGVWLEISFPTESSGRAALEARVANFWVWPWEWAVEMTEGRQWKLLAP